MFKIPKQEYTTEFKALVAKRGCGHGRPTWNSASCPLPAHGTAYPATS